MDKEEVRRWIRRLNDEHENDHDGGYALVDALKQAQKQVEPKSQGLFAETLAEFVRAEDPELWAVALEALVQLGSRREVASLGQEVTQSTRDQKWKDNVVLGLLRLDQGEFRDAIIKHVRGSLESPRNLTVPIIAALCRIDRAACLDISSTYFEAAHAGQRVRDVEGFVPAFVRSFLAIDDHLLAELVRRVGGVRPEAGRWLARCLADYLSKPWVVEELGDDRSTSVRADIDAAANVVN